MDICPNCYGKVSENTCSSCAAEVDPINEYTVIDVDVDRIYSDSDFNCRGNIMPIDVMDLVEDIRANSLQFPIAVQPVSDIETPQEEFDFRIIAGHRRFQAIKILKSKTIPCMVKVGLSELQARLLNLGENLKRKDLNIMQEAGAIRHLAQLGMNRRQISEKLGTSSSWTQVRLNLLSMPKPIQEEAAAGMLNQAQIKELYGMKDPDRQFAAVRKIKEAKEKGVRGFSVAKKPEEDPYKKKRHAKNVVQDMIEHMIETIGWGLHTRALAWANGEISTADLFEDMKEFAGENGLEYLSPIEGSLV